MQRREERRRLEEQRQKEEAEEAAAKKKRAASEVGARSIVRRQALGGCKRLCGWGGGCCEAFA
jgi:hypothetical protein